MKDSGKFFFTISLILIFSTYTNASNTVDNSESNLKIQTKAQHKILITSGAIIGLVCLLSLVMVYTILNKRKFLSSKKDENQKDKEKGGVDDENNLEELFKSTASNEDKFKEKDLKCKSLSNENVFDQRAAKVHGFLMRAMTLPQNIIQTVGKIQTIQITEPNINAEQQLPIKQQNSTTTNITSLSNSPTGNISLISASSSPKIERPANFKNRPTAIKSPSSTYLKKSPSPTGQKSPPQHTPSSQQTESNELTKEEDKPITNKEQSASCSTTDNCSSKSEFDDTNGEFRLGKIQFCLKYNYEKHAITVSMIKCMNLPGPRVPGKNMMNTYVKLQLLPEKKHKVKTRTIRKNQNPCYQEDFTFFNIQPAQLDNLALHFMIMSFDRYSRDEVLGEVLHPCSDQFDTLEKQVSVILDICPKGLLSRAQGQGEILLSLCYHPSSALLSLVVLKAKNLQKANITGLPDPYVKINLYINNKRIAKKKTHSKKRTLNPIYNEIFSFELSSYLTPEAGGESNSNDNCVDLSNWEDIKLELIVIDYDRITRNENIGCLTLCINDQDANVRKHMKDMLHSPRKQIACWHKLRQV